MRDGLPDTLANYLDEVYGMADEKGEHWAKDAFKEAHRGRLHRRLGVPENENIPDDLMHEALSGKHGPEVQEMAQAAHNINR